MEAWLACDEDGFPLGDSRSPLQLGGYEDEFGLFHCNLKRKRKPKKNKVKESIAAAKSFPSSPSQEHDDCERIGRHDGKVHEVNLSYPTLGQACSVESMKCMNSKEYVEKEETYVDITWSRRASTWTRRTSAIS